MRVRVYVDGFNVYYRALKHTDYKWLNPLLLARSLLDPVDTIDRVRYFTARVSPRAGDPEAPKRQQAYLSALGTVAEVTVHYGRFLPKEKTRPLAHDPSRFATVLDSEEKGSDVNLASFLLMDGWKGRYDAALILSQDTDLCEPLRMVKQELRKEVGVVWLEDSQPGRRFRSCTSFIRHATPARLRAAQFPPALRGRDGQEINKPDAW
jgi:hypothetical protein